MRIKKGFTLSEILIVLMIIGFIAALTVPSLMKNINEAQIKTAYKKAFNTISNLASLEKISGQMPITASADESRKLFNSLATNLSVKGFAIGGDEITQASGELKNNAANHIDAITYTLGTSDDVIRVGTINAGETKQLTDAGVGTVSDWIITEDNLAYSIALGTAQGTCLSKADINATQSTADAAAASCAMVVVDTNGLGKGPNMLELQYGATMPQPGTNMTTLVGDWYYIFIGIDGATPGPKNHTVSGRIIAEIK